MQGSLYTNAKMGCGWAIRLFGHPKFPKGANDFRVKKWGVCVFIEPIPSNYLLYIMGKVSNT